MDVDEANQIRFGGLMIYRKEIDSGGQRLIVETGKLAKLANGSVWVQYGDTVVLAATVANREQSPDQDFFPLTVDYREKAYAAGKIPGGYIKREGRPSETEILSARLIDRSLRPMFPEGFKNEVQVFVWVLSADKENDADILGIIGASTALSISDIPFDGPISGVRVGRVNGEFIANPKFAQTEESEIDLVIAGSEDSIIMVEGETKEISEDLMLEALRFGHEQIRQTIAMQKELVAECGKPKFDFEIAQPDANLIAEVNELLNGRLRDILYNPNRDQRRDDLTQLHKEVVEKLAEKYPESEAQIAEILHEMEREIVRNMILTENRRLDERTTDQIRPISIEVGLLPRVHGSALFTRGQTQSLTATTLGTKIDEQKMDELEGEFFKSYMLHYNFPSFSVGETRQSFGPSRREIGHGNLAERAIKAMIPAEGLFPYTVRVVSEILESNGSSSMATVCAASLSLMDAGVPIKTSVAGIAMGLIKQDDRFVVLTDILGDEDHLGDMDFKVAGSRTGITAFQMDIKVKGISFDIMREALDRAKTGRLYILDLMDKILLSPRKDLSQYAPRIISFKINPENIGIVIGPGGKMIREIIEVTGATIDISDDGTVLVASVDSAAADEARRIIENLVQEPELGKIYKGKVKKIMNFGAFVEILPGKEGLLHISEIEHYRIAKVEDVLKVGDEVEVKLMKIDENGKLDLSRKVLLTKSDAPGPTRERPSGSGRPRY